MESYEIDWQDEKIKDFASSLVKKIEEGEIHQNLLIRK